MSKAKQSKLEIVAKILSYLKIISFIGFIGLPFFYGETVYQYFVDNFSTPASKTFGMEVVLTFGVFIMPLLTIIRIEIFVDNRLSMIHKEKEKEFARKKRASNLYVKK